MKKLSTIILITSCIVNYAQTTTFNFTDGTVTSGSGSSSQVTETINSLTLTCSAPNGIILTNSTFGVISGNYIKQFSASTPVTFAFDQTVNISSIALINDIFPSADEIMVFTPIPMGSNSIVSQSISNDNGNVVTLNFVSINSFTVTKSAGGNFQYDFDNIVMDPSLPVELISFTAVKLKEAVNLLWQTATEVNNYGFEIERKKTEDSGQESVWETLGFVQGHGNSNSPKSYEFIDEDLPAGELTYRLKQIDTDGSYEYYGTTVNVDNVTGVEAGNLPYEFSLRQNYPNPFNPSTTIKYTIPNIVETGRDLSLLNVTLKVYDILGSEVAMLVNTRQAPGEYEVEFSGEHLPSGVYIYKLQVGDKFSSQRKMALMK